MPIRLTHEEVLCVMGKSFLIREATLQQAVAATKQYYHKKLDVFYTDISKKLTSDQKSGKVISLFSGAGGLDLGLEMAGFETSVCVEIDPDCRETLRYNRPAWRLFEKYDGRLPGDIRSISAEELLDFAQIRRGEAALVVGGAPCQPFSNIGKKLGANDRKNGDLFLEFVRIVRGVSPKAFIFENVVGITQARHSQILDHMKRTFEGEGYALSYCILNSADYGTPQRRERFFLIGIKECDAPAFPLPTHFKSLKDWDRFASGFEKTPRSKPSSWITVGEAFTILNGSSKLRPDYAVMNISKMVQDRMKLIGPGENFKVLPNSMRPKCWRDGKHQGQDTFGRLRLDEPSITIRTAAYNPAKGKYIHPNENRGLSTIEMAVLQGFPLSWTFKCVGRQRVTLVGAGRQIGNAVPPPLAKAIGLAIRQQLPEN
ncbi:MAG: DNA cytosine methyltransferase [Candidatus Zixiibacteriota bacterium]